MLDMLIYSYRFWQNFKNSEALNIFIKAQQKFGNDNLSAAMRTKALKIIKNLSLINHDQLPPRDDDMGGRYQQFPTRDYVDPNRGVLPQQS